MTENHYRVLLIEDNPTDARLIEILLGEARSATFAFEWRRNLAAGLERAAAGDLDLVLLDLSLPDSFGIQTFQTAHAHVRGIPIVVLSGHDDEELAVRAVQEGAQDYLVKGYDPSGVTVRSIRYAIERFRASEQLRRREEHMRLMTEQLPCLFWTTDLNLRITSSAGTRGAGLDLRPEVVVGKTLYEYFETDNADLPFIHAHLVAAQGESRTFELRWRGRYYHVHVEPFRSADNKVGGTIGVALDVTDQKLIQLELRVARQIQEGLRPGTAPKLPGIDIAGKSVAADEAGGDFYDYLTLDDGQTGVLIGDVGGHGLGPAMLMCQTRAYLRAVAKTQTDVGEVLTQVNRFLCADTNESRLVAAMFVKICPRERTVIYAAAGHRGYRLAADGSSRLLDHTGIPLNVAPDSPVRCAAPFHLESGDTLVLYTDGIVEPTNPEGQSFGSDRMLEIVYQHRDKTSREIVETLFAAVETFSPEFCHGDDMTAVIIKVK